MVPRINRTALRRSAPGLLLRGKLPANVAHHLSAETFELTSESAAAFEMDGEWLGKLPVTFSVEREKTTRGGPVILSALNGCAGNSPSTTRPMPSRRG